jgi:hypothetical protein
MTSLKELHRLAWIDAASPNVPNSPKARPNCELKFVTIVCQQRPGQTILEPACFPMQKCFIAL